MTRPIFCSKGFKCTVYGLDKTGFCPGTLRAARPRATRGQGLCLHFPNPPTQRLVENPLALVGKCPGAQGGWVPTHILENDQWLEAL
jgi:hypothetical protein